MDIYAIALFAHIVGALLVFVLLTVEGLGLRFGFAYAQLSRVVGPVSALLVLVPGLYMMKVQWGWTAWVVTSLAVYGVIAAVGAYTGIRVMRRTMGVRSATVSWLVRIGMALGIVFDMTVKPDVIASIVAVAVAVAVAMAAAVPAMRLAKAA